MNLRLLILFTALFAASSLNASAADATKPNVLLLVVDDLNSWLLGGTNRYAGKVVVPKIQRLAESGARAPVEVVVLGLVGPRDAIKAE